jgi:CheY-like chemotaxis protein
MDFTSVVTFENLQIMIYDSPVTIHDLMKVLIIDDEDDIRMISRLSLGRIGGMDVVEASSGVDGLTKAESEKPDAILLDVMMPLMDGPTMLGKLRENPATSAIPVVFLTAKAMASEIERLKSLGAAGVLTKPFDPMTLAEQFKTVLASQ